MREKKNTHVLETTPKWKLSHSCETKTTWQATPERLPEQKFTSDRRRKLAWCLSSLVTEKKPVKLSCSLLYGVPSLPKFNVAFCILLFAFYPTSVIWHPSLHFRHSTFLVQHSSFCLVHSPFRTQYSSSRSSSAGCTFKFSHSMLSICQSSFCFQHLTLRISLASLHCTFNFSNCTFHPLIIHQG